ncbi:hypothetical protein EG68_12114 [Paragonimus skrjabini miyazakii]|uniref:Uncharacterized protein n=1 Tax=Paragonimus skrjabini miyazakii TaxID=59628 RepID=A0A8S9YFD3_9TREM|nr:hypothetical protein EG68_12114 [Paragonimus skrjabini miyazakii]
MLNSLKKKGKRTSYVVGNTERNNRNRCHDDAQDKKRGERPMTNKFTQPAISERKEEDLSSNELYCPLYERRYRQEPKLYS